MAIRKDLDDMLNSLKTGAPTASKAEVPKPAGAAHHRKSVYDEMSVDDLLSALKDEKKSAVQKKSVSEKKPEKTPVRTEKNILPHKPSAVDPELERKLTEALKPAAKPLARAVKTPEAEAKPAAIPKAEARTVSAPKAEARPAASPKAEAKPIAAPKPETKLAETAVTEAKPTEAEAPKERKKKKKIIITGELPDYEAIRREELEKNRIESEKAAAAAKSAARQANELTPAEAIAAEVIAAAEAKAPEELPEPEPVPEAETPQESAAPEETAEEPAEEKQKGGFFSKRKNKRRRNAEEETAPEFEEAVLHEDAPSIEDADLNNENTAEEAAPSADIEIAAETAIADAFSEAIAEAVPEDLTELEPAEDDLPSVDELLDSAIAELEKAQAADASEEAQNTETEASAEEETESSAVSGLIDDIREDAAAAIAELEKTPEEKAEEAEKAAPAEEMIPEKSSAESAPQAEEKPKKKLVLRRILDENPNDIINERSEKTEDDEDAPIEKQKVGFKKRLYMILGAVFSIFAVIGIITVIVKGVGLARSFTSGEIKKDGFTEIIYPAVIMDIESFNAPTELTSNQMITAAIWSIVMSEERVSKYSVSPGTDTIFIPYMDVEARAVEMFGPNHPEFNHCTVGPLESRFVYSDGAYNVKLSPITFTYSPEIKSIVKSGNKYTLTVDYIDELPMWMEKSVAKSVEFKLTEKEDGSYTIDSMEILFVKSSNI